MNSFRSSEYEPIYSQNFGSTKYVAVYAAKTYSNTLCLLGLLQPPFFNLFPRFLNFKNNRNTYEYIVMFRDIIDDIMESYWKHIKQIEREYNKHNKQTLWSY